MATWQELETELTLWRDAGVRPTFWWRDDDTVAPTDDLDRLIAIAEAQDAPLHLAVIPAGLSPHLAPRLATAPLVYTLQHGLAHKNHETKPLRASEVGVSRDTDLQRADLAKGWRLMAEAGLPRRLPVFVPPWNRIAQTTLPVLAEMGYAAVSTFDAAPDPAPGLPQINGHIDPIRWKGGAHFSGTEKTLEQCLRHLRQRRTGAVAQSETTGFVTHHLQHDAGTWDFTQEFLARLTHGGHSRWIALPEILPKGSPLG